jgi:hypothetical protein
MNEEIANMLNSDTPKNQDGNTVEAESESSVIGIIFNMLGGLSYLIAVAQFIEEHTEVGFYMIGAGLSCSAIGAVLGYLARISSRLQRISKSKD